MIRYVYILSEIVLLGLFFCVGAFLGYRYEYNSTLATQTKQAEYIVKLEQQNAKQSDKIVTRYVTKTRIIHDKAKAIIRRVKVYVPVNVDYFVPNGFVRMLNDSASGELSSASGNFDDKASSYHLSSVGKIISQNYEACRENTQQLMALQNWVRKASKQ